MCNSHTDYGLREELLTLRKEEEREERREAEARKRAEDKKLSADKEQVLVRS